MNRVKQVAAIFSASRPPGIGLEVARRLSAAGLDIVCIENAVRNAPPDKSDLGKQEALDALVDEIRGKGGSIRTIASDVTQPGEVDRAVARVIAEAGRIDVAIVMNGGTGPGNGSGPLLEVSDEAAGRAVHLNLVVPFLVARACAREMMRQKSGGSIVLQSSHGAVAPSPLSGMFGAARAGLNYMLRIFAMELGPHNIRVNAINPLGVVPDGDVSGNPGIAHVVAQTGGDAARSFADMIPMGRPQTPAESAAVMVFLALDATFVTGEAWTVAGGSVRY
jgi:NAD(P)-dependent dehydrogenase (short-subunit alcohol dehydrogenase family)